MFQITCTEQTGNVHTGHITGVGVYGGTRWTVDEVWASIDRGTVFYTYGGGRRATVHKYNCPCGRRSLRSGADATTANNLDSLSLCSWAA
jgi:hypothetical protein